MAYCECHITTTSFYQNHGECEYCFYGIEDSPAKPKWRIICWDTGDILDFECYNPIKFMKKHILFYRGHDKDFKNYTLEVLK